MDDEKEKSIQEKVDKISTIQRVFLAVLLITMVFYPITSWIFNYKAPSVYLTLLFIEGISLLILAAIKVKIQVSNFAKYYKKIYLSQHPDRSQGLEETEDKKSTKK
ncbi:hypothetical protein FP435_00135 (plasmid) [Lactobacillus sp. PV037]|uniref:hypothetical protein n=1 Tax=Lactobacillus sp. PV037 TaxID=2594496 RepID=UPI00223FFECA|nr:hypothetical protein [Lactobacillus sp. PV037]QNQ82946.1 hypothetical protein FP435_00135 [Lactobacillus sp. PV037]